MATALGRLDAVDTGDDDYDIFRAACVKDFEVILDSDASASAVHGRAA